MGGSCNQELDFLRENLLFISLKLHKCVEYCVNVFVKQAVAHQGFSPNHPPKNDKEKEKSKHELLFSQNTNQLFKKHVVFRKSWKLRICFAEHNLNDRVTWTVVANVIFLKFEFC